MVRKVCVLTPSLLVRSTLAASGIKDFRKMLAHCEAVTPIRRTVTIEDVGNSAAFLCSDLSAGISGEVVHVDGGFSIAAMNELRTEIIVLLVNMGGVPAARYLYYTFLIFVIADPSFSLPPCVRITISSLRPRSAHGTTPSPAKATGIMKRNPVLRSRRSASGPEAAKVSDPFLLDVIL